MEKEMIRNIAVGLLLLMLAVPVLSQQQRDEDGYTLDELKGKTAKFQRVQITGFVLLGLGAVSAVSGIAMMSTAHWDTYSTETGTTTSTSDPQGGAGMIMTVVGVPLIIAGTVLAIIGTHKHHDYQQRVHMFSSYDPTRKAFRETLVFNLPSLGTK